MISKSHLSRFFDLVHEMQGMKDFIVDFDESFLNQIKCIPSNDKKIQSFEYQNRLSLIEFFKEDNILADCTSFGELQLNKSPDTFLFPKILICKLVSQSIALYIRQDYSDFEHLFCTFMTELKLLNHLSMKYVELINLAFICVSIYASSNDSFELTILTLTHFCHYLSSLPFLEQDCYKYIVLVLKHLPLSLTKEMYNELTDTFIYLLQQKAKFFMVEKPVEIVDLLSAYFHKFDNRALKLVALFSLYSSCDHIHQMFASLPSILFSEIGKTKLEYNKKYQICQNLDTITYNSDKLFKHPLNLPEYFPQFSFEKVEDSMKLIDLFDDNIQSIMNKIGEALSCSSIYSIINFVNSYGKLLDITYSVPNTIHAIATLLYLANYMKNATKAKSMISKLLSSIIFQNDYCIFTSQEIDPVIGLARNLIIQKVVVVDQLLLLQILAIGSTNPHLFCECILRMYKTNVILDFNAFSHSNLITLLLSVGTSLSEMKDNDEEKIIFFTFLFEGLESRAFMFTAFSNPDFVKTFLGLLQEHNLQAKVIQVLKNVYNTLNDNTTNYLEKSLSKTSFYNDFQDLALTNVLVQTLRSIYTTNPECHQNFKSIVATIVELLNENPSETMLVDLLEMFAYRKEGLSVEEINTVYRNIYVFHMGLKLWEAESSWQKTVERRLWEIAAGYTGVTSVSQMHITQPSVLPLLFHINKNTDSLIDIFSEQIDYSLYNCSKLHEGYVDLIILTYLGKMKDVELHNCLIKLNIKNVSKALKLVEGIIRYSCDNSIISTVAEIICQGKSKYVIDIAKTFESALAFASSISKPLFTLGFIKEQFSQPITDDIFSSGFTMSLVMKVCAKTVASLSINLCLMSITDSVGNSLRVLLSNSSLMMVIKNNRKKIVATLARSFLTEEWFHIMLSVAIDENGMTCYPVIDDVLADAVPIRFKPAFGENIKVNLGGYDETEYDKILTSMIGICHSFTFYNRPLTDTECAHLKENPRDLNYNPIASTVKYTPDEISKFNMPRTIVEACLETHITHSFDKFFEIRHDVDENLILIVLGILEIIYRLSPPEQIHLKPDLVCYFLLSQTDPSVLLYTGSLAFFKSLTMTNRKQKWMDKIQLNPYIWSKSSNRTIIYKTMAHNMVNFDYDHINASIITRFIKVFYQTEYNKELENLLIRISPLTVEEHITILFSQAINSKDLKLLGILRILLSVNENLLIANPYKKLFINYLHSCVSSENIYIAKTAILLIHQMCLNSTNLHLLHSAFALLLNSKECLQVFNLLIEDIQYYPSIANFMCLIAINLDSIQQGNFARHLYPLSSIPDFSAKIILDESWYLYPLILSYHVQDYEGTNNYIRILLRHSSKYESDIITMTVFTMFIDSLAIHGAKNNMLSLLGAIIKEEFEEEKLNFLIEMVALLTLFHIQNGVSNYNIDKNCAKEAKIYKIMPLNNLMNFIRLDLINIPLVFQAIIEDDGSWNLSSIGSFILNLVSERQVKAPRIVEIINNFVFGRKGQNIKQTVETAHKAYQKIVRQGVLEFSSPISVFVTVINSYIQNMPKMKYDKLQEFAKVANYPKETLRRIPILTYDNTLTLTFIQVKLKLQNQYVEKYEKKKIPVNRGINFEGQIVKLTKSVDCLFCIFQSRFIIQCNKTYIIEHDDIEYFLLRSANAFEIINCYGKSFYLLFQHSDFQEILKQVYQCVMRNARIIQRSISSSVFSATKTLSKWHTCRISNFMLLIYLNIFGGRSFRNPSDYPIFPRVFDRNFNILTECPPFEAEHRGPIEGNFEERVLTHDAAAPETFFFAEKAADYIKPFTSPHEFIFQHRLALESEQVTKWLPLWIDQHFGTKAHFNSIIFGSVKPRKPLTDAVSNHLADKKLDIDHIFRMASFKNKMIYLMKDGTVIKTKKDIGRIEPVEDILFAPCNLFTYAYSKTMRTMWKVSGKEITSSYFPFQSCCFFVLTNEVITFQSCETSLSTFNTETNEIKFFCSLPRRILRCMGNRVTRTVVIATDDNKVSVFDSTGKFVNSYSIGSEIKSMLQCGQLGHIVLRTKTDIFILSASCNEVKRVPLMHKISRWFCVQNINQMDVVLFEADGKVFAFHPVYPENPKEICSNIPGGIISCDFNKELRLFSITFESGVVKHFNFDII